MICKYCNAFIDDNSMFCASCGQKVEAEPAAAPVFSSAFHHAGSLDGSSSGIGAPVVEKKPAAPQEDGGLRFSSSFNRPRGISDKNIEDVPRKNSTQFDATKDSCAYISPKDISKRGVPDKISAPDDNAFTVDYSSNKKRTKKRRRWIPISVAICLLMVIIIIITFLTGDRTADRKTETQIINDLIAYELYSADTVYDSLSVSKRQTQEENLTDTVYVTIRSHTDYVQKVESFILVYNLYDSGWILDSVQQDWDGENNTIPLTGPGESFVDSLFEEYNSQHTDLRRDPPYEHWVITDSEVDLSNMTAYYIVEAKRELPLWDTYEEIRISCFFDNVWYSGNTIEEGIEKIDIDRTKLIGTYQNDEGYLEIIDVDNENNTITLLCYKKSVWGGDILDWSGTFPFDLGYGDDASYYRTMIICHLDTIWNLDIYPYSIYIDCETSASQILCFYDYEQQ